MKVDVNTVLREVVQQIDEVLSPRVRCPRCGREGTVYRDPTVVVRAKCECGWMLPVQPLSEIRREQSL